MKSRDGIASGSVAMRSSARASGSSSSCGHGWRASIISTIVHPQLQLRSSLEDNAAYHTISASGIFTIPESSSFEKVAHQCGINYFAENPPSNKKPQSIL